uniref:C2H2-type domain-containing protein n=1 Tax=viral metagenome TaxID=1070528 RepID=A0A6C0EPV5_9ZZZZ
MEFLNTFIKTIKGYYLCVCQSRFDTIEEAHEHMSVEYIGYCNNGLKYSDNNRYECRCGTSNMTRQYAALTHYYELKGNCIDKKNLITRTTCKICDNKEFHTDAWFKRHCETKGHQNRLLYGNLINLECKKCNIKCRSQTEIRKHLETKRHITQQHSKKEQLSLECSTCNIKCRGQKEMKTHLATKKHMKKVLLA